MGEENAFFGQSRLHIQQSRVTNGTVTEQNIACIAALLGSSPQGALLQTLHHLQAGCCPQNLDQTQTQEGSHLGQQFNIFQS